MDSNTYKEKKYIIYSGSEHTVVVYELLWGTPVCNNSSSAGLRVEIAAALIKRMGFLRATTLRRQRRYY